MPLINCEINLILPWSEKCVHFSSNIIRGQYWKSSNIIRNNWYKFYVRVVTLSTQDNAKLLQQLKSDFKRTVN